MPVQNCIVGMLQTHVKEYPTLHYFEIPRHAQPMLEILGIPVHNYIGGMLQTCPVIYGRRGTDKHTYQQTAIDLNVLYPLATALHIAILSAHNVSPYEAFSTLHPVR